MITNIKKDDRMVVFLVFDPIIIQSQLKIILRREAGIDEITTLAGPFLESAIIEELMIFIDYERHDIVLQALLEHNQSTDTAVSVLERVNSLKSHVELDYILKRNILKRIVPSQK